MHIHTVKENETVYGIARSYGASPTKIMENNALRSPDDLTVGDELLIVMPTRSYTVRDGDSIEAIAKRFGVYKSDIIKYNPSLSGRDKIYPEQVLAVKHSSPTHAICLVNGYLYDNRHRDELISALAHISYLTLSAHSYRNGRLQLRFNPSDAVSIAKESGKSVLMRIYLSGEDTKDLLSESFTEGAIKEAAAIGADGITLALGASVCKRGLEDGLMNMKKRLSEAGLMLFIEGAINPDPIYTDIGDCYVIGIDSCAPPDALGFRRGEEIPMRKYREACESCRTLVDISPFGYRGGESLEIREIKKIARRTRTKIECDEENLICSFSDRGTVSFPSLKSIKAKLDLIGELGFLGVCIDIARCPTEHLMMISTEFISGMNHFPI